jgi:hypothetical protein
LAFVALVGAACTSGTSDGAGLPSTLAPVPPTTAVPYVEPSALRVVEVADPYTVGPLTPVSSTEVLAWAAPVVDEEGRSYPSNTPLVIDVTSGNSEPIPPPYESPPTASSLEIVGNAVFLVASLCPSPEESGCSDFSLEVWRLDLTTRAWDEVGRYGADELVEARKRDSYFRVQLEQAGERFLVVGIIDESELHEGARHGIDTVTGTVIPAPPRTYDRPRSTPYCRTASGARATANASDGWTLQVRPVGVAEFVRFDEVAPSYLLTCAASSVWTLTDEAWVGVTDTAEPIASTPIPGILDPDVVQRGGDVVGESTGHPTLVMLLGRDLYGDVFREVDAEEMVVLTGGSTPPLVHRGPAAAPGAPLDPLLAYRFPDWALQLPGGRIVVPIGVDGTQLLVAE